MKCWTILALLVTVCAVFLGVGRTEETEDDFRETLEDINSDTENVVQLADSFKNPETDDDDDDETENALESVNETPSNDEDESEMFKRAPWGRRRRRRRFWRKIKDKLKKIRNKVCGWLKNSEHKIIRWGCRYTNGDEEYPRVSNDENFITAQEADELLKQGWVQRDE